MKPLLAITGFFLFAALLGAADYEPPDYTDSGVGCVDDCLEPMDVQPIAIWEV